VGAVDDADWLDDREQGAWRAFVQTYLQLNAVLGRELLEESGLSIQDYGVLVALSESPGGQMRSFELGRVLGWEKSRVSHHVSRMTDRGLVARHKCPTDQRGAFVVITSRGRKAITSAAPGHVAAVRRYFVGLLTTQELDVLEQIGNKVVGALPDTSAAE
jgi:DNA-binding MarR family transcriptional regulator